LRLSEDDFSIPSPSTLKLGEALTSNIVEKQLGGTNIGTGTNSLSPRILNIKSFNSIGGAAERSKSTIEKSVNFNDGILKYIPSDRVVKESAEEDESVKSGGGTHRGSPKESETKRLKREAGKIVRRGLLAALRFGDINRDSMFASMLSSWFLKYKSLKPPSYLVEDTEEVTHFETKLFNTIRAANLQSLSRKIFKQI
jgi:hypothetical protein